MYTVTRSPTRDVRREFATVVNQVAFAGNYVGIERNGHVIAGLLPKADFEFIDELRRAETIEDLLNALNRKDTLGDRIVTDRLHKAVLALTAGGSGGDGVLLLDFPELTTSVTNDKTTGINAAYPDKGLAFLQLSIVQMAGKTFIQGNYTPSEPGLKIELQLPNNAGTIAAEAFQGVGEDFYLPRTEVPEDCSLELIRVKFKKD